MSTQVICDGCARPVTEPKSIGHITPRDYCPDCGVLADRFQDAEEALRKNLHERFTTDRALLISQFSVNGFKLPDIA